MILSKLKPSMKDHSPQPNCAEVFHYTGWLIYLSSSVAWMTCSFLSSSEVCHYSLRWDEGVKGWRGGSVQGTNKRSWESHWSILEFRFPNAAAPLSETLLSDAQGSVTWWWGPSENGLPEERNHLEWIERCLQLGLSFCKAVFASPLANTGCDESWMAPFY